MEEIAAMAASEAAVGGRGERCDFIAAPFVDQSTIEE